MYKVLRNKTDGVHRIQVKEDTWECIPCVLEVYEVAQSLSSSEEKNELAYSNCTADDNY